MKLKIYYRSSVVWNTMLYIVLSLIFLYLQNISINSASIFNKEYLKNFLVSYLPFCLYLGLVILYLYKIKENAKYLFLTVALLVSGITVYNLVYEFTKLTLIILFFYQLIAYYFYQFYSLDVGESFYKPNYKRDELFDPFLVKIKAELVDITDKSIRGSLTNWSSEGCFICLNEKFTLKKNKKMKLKVILQGSTFEQIVKLVSLTGEKQGIGLKVINSAEQTNGLGWNQFYGIINEMGYSPELLK